VPLFRLPGRRSASGSPPEESAAETITDHVDHSDLPSLADVSPEVLRGQRRRVTVLGEPVLHRPCRHVRTFGTSELRGLVDDLFATMAVADGVGLAANQIGVDLAVFVFDCPDDDGVQQVGHVVNPVLDTSVTRSAARVVQDEGCLSVPGPVGEVARAEQATVRGFDVAGRPVRYDSSGFLARCFQHEVDHLGGLLYVDHLGPRSRRRVRREMAQMRSEVWAHWDERAAALSKATGLNT
jgi:peptide deformylase